MEKIYRVKLNSKGMPNFATAEEVADRPQGEWIYRTDVGWHATRQCSLCGWMQSYSDTKYMGYRYNYCPHCGCRMKGAGDE